MAEKASDERLRDFENIHIYYLCIFTGFWRLNRFFNRGKKIKKIAGIFCTSLQDVFYFRVLSLIGTELRGGSYMTPPRPE